MNAAMTGSTREDEPAVRTINHFYDPVYQQGLNSRQAEALAPFIGVLKPFIKSAKEWAQNSSAQANFLGEFYHNAALNPYARLTKNSIDIATTHTWDKAIYEYISGDKKSAFENLGHILHLLEDMAVPAHTRNDHHLTGDPYEQWASSFTPANIHIAAIGQPSQFNTLNDYFDSFAIYTNKNFYSKDTIGIQSGYNLPECDPINVKMIKGSFYCLHKDSVGEYLLAGKSGNNSALLSTKFNISIDDNLIHQDYWSHLSQQTVSYGAGVVHLFFQEVEKDKNNPSFVSEMKRTALGDLVNSAKDFFSDLFNSKNQNLAVVTPSPTASMVPQILTASSFASATPEINSTPTPFYVETAAKVVFKLLPIPAPQPVSTNSVLPTPGLTPLSSPTPTPTPTPVIQPSPAQIFTSGSYSSPTHTPTPTPIVYCDQNGVLISDDQPIIINEIAWMGSGTSANDEWLELKNISEQSVDIKNWQLLDKDEQIKIVFGQKGENTILTSNQIYLLERTDDDSVPDIPADLIYTGAINDSDESLKLFASDCHLVDEVNTDPKWPAGDGDEHLTMERSSDLTWYTYNGPGINGIFGTPKQENRLLATPEPTIEPTPEPTPIPTPTSAPTPLPKILISEIVYDAPESDEGKEFIELYNPESYGANLENWILEVLESDVTSTKPLAKFGQKTEDIVQIGSRGYLLAGLNNYDPANYAGRIVDISRSASLTQKKEVSYAVRLLSPDGDLIDSISYQAETASGKGLERKANEQSTGESMTIGEDRFLGNTYDTDDMADFIIRDNPEPQNSENLPEPRSKPPKVINLSGEIRENDELVLSFDLGGVVIDSPSFNVKFAYSPQEITEENWDNLPSPNSTAIIFNDAIQRYETSLVGFSEGVYYFAIKSQDSEELDSDMSDIYEFIILFCSPHYFDVGNLYINNIAFYSCLGKNWLDFSLYNFPNPLYCTDRYCALGFSFLLNKTENDFYCNDGKCFFGFYARPDSALNVKEWYGIGLRNPTNLTDSFFIVSDNSSNVDLDWTPDVPHSFHFEIDGTFQEIDFIAPAVFNFQGGNGWWWNIKESQAKDYLLFEKNPRKVLAPEPENFSAVFEEPNKKIIFQFQIGGEGELSYDIRYRTDGPVTNINWNGSASLASGLMPSNVMATIEADASTLETDKNYYFGLKIFNNFRYSSVARSEAFIPYPLLDCSVYQGNPVFCENFESYSVGPFFGENYKQGDWASGSNSGPWTIESNKGKRSSQALRGRYSGIAWTYRDFPGFSLNGGLSLWVAPQNSETQVIVSIDPNISVRWGGDGYLYLKNGSNNVVYPVRIFPNNWSRWYFVWDASAAKYKFKVDNNDWLVLDWNPVAGAKQLSFLVEGRNGEVYFDDIVPYQEQ
jgi:hypothetical protein